MRRTYLVVFLCVSGLLATRTLLASEPQGEVNRRVTINTISVYHGVDETFGALTKVSIWFDRSDDKRTRIAFIEDEIDGFGDMWRGAAWQAAMLAADLCGHDLAGTRIFLERSGRVDGPSAGAITTVGVLAALRGDTVRSDVAMTGTVNPDGTIGPVGGIPHKIDGAAAAGMKLVLVPYGMRNDWDSVLEKNVDLIERGANQGVEVKMVGDVYTAYELMTGKELPRSAPAPAPTLNHAVYGKLRIFIDEWLVRYREQLSRYNEVPERYRSDYTDELIEEAATWVEGIDELLSEGQAPAAYNDMVDATVKAGIASETARTIWVDKQRGRKEAVIYAERFAQLPLKIRFATQKLKSYKPKTLGQVGTVIYSYATLTGSLCYQDLGERVLSGQLKMPMFMDIEDEDEEQLERILEAVTYMQYAAYNCAMVSDNLEYADLLKGQPLPENMPLAATAEFFRRTAQANLNQFEKSIIDVKADALGVSFDKMKNHVLVDEEDYLLAWWGVHHARAKLYSQFEGEALSYAKLGLAIHTYALSSSLMVRDYSLVQEVDDNGVVTGVKRDSSLKFMLDFSEDQSRRNVRSLRDAGVDASDVVFSYMSAGVLRGGDIGSRLYALQMLWEANIVSRTLAYLGGFADGLSGSEASTAVSGQ